MGCMVTGKVDGGRWVQARVQCSVCRVPYTQWPYRPLYFGRWPLAVGRCDWATGRLGDWPLAERRGRGHGIGERAWGMAPEEARRGCVGVGQRGQRGQRAQSRGLVVGW